VSRLRIGVALGYWPWLAFEEQVRIALLADELGLDSVWSAEAYGQDCVSLLGYLAARTERVGLGTMIMQIPARKPTTAAMAAASIDVMSGGRMRLGLGLTGPQISEGWYGVPFGQPLKRTREYVATVRDVLAGEPVQVRLDDTGYKPAGLGKPLKLLAKPVQDRIPIWLGAFRPKAIEQAAEIADGWAPAFFPLGDSELMLGPFEAGLRRAGRSRAEITVMPGTAIAVDDDLDRARDLLRPLLGIYLGGMGAKEKNFYVELADSIGYGDEAREVQRLFLSGDRKAAEATVPVGFIDSVAIATTPGGLDDRLAAYERAGVDGLFLVPQGDKEAVLRAVARATL